MSNLPASRAGLERDLVLNDGTRVRLRPIRPDDESRLIAFHSRLSIETRHQRFFTAPRVLTPEAARRLVTVDYDRRFALVAEVTDGGEPSIVGVARYEAIGPEVAEGAVVVEDAWQHRGLGKALLRGLFEAAGARGIRRFRAFTLHDNVRLMRTLQTLGRIERSEIAGDIVELDYVPFD